MGFYRTMTSRYGIRTSDIMKEWSNNNRKIANLLNRRIFLLECKRLGLTPNHIGTGVKNVLNLVEFHTGSRFNKKISGFNKNLVNRLLSLEIEHTHLKISHICKYNSTIKRELRQTIPTEIHREFFRRQKTTYNKIFHKVKATNLRKIKALQRRIHKADYKVPEKWFKNLSQTTVPEEVRTVLGLGSKFNVPLDHKEINIKDLIADVESILDLVEEDRRDTLRAKIASIITGHLHKGKNNICATDNIRKLYKTTKNFLRTNDHLVVLDSDKGSVTVLMDRADYLQKMYSIVDTDDFKKISRDPTTTIQNKTNKIISTLVNQNILSKEAARSMKSYNSVSPRMYGNPKIHKENIPMRPIVSDVQGPTCKFSNYIAQILTEAYDQDNAYYVKDSFDFSSKINNFELPPDYVVISLDVVNLFGNISKELVLRAMEFHWNKIEAVCNISKEYFKEIITFLLESGYFMFDGSFYLQMFGCIMGSRLSPILSLYVMDYVLDSCIPRLTFTLAFIKKYVDDLIISLPSTGTEEILQVFNSFDPKLKFTIETEDCYNSVPFLDTKVCRVDNKVKLNWYRKTTSAGKFIHFLSDHPMSIKLNFIKEQKNRIYKICDPTFRDGSMKRLFDLLVENAYPKTMLKKLLYSTSMLPSTESQTQPDMVGETEVVKYRSIPNIPYLTYKIKNCFKDYNKKVKIVAQCKKKVANLYSKLKDPIPKEIKSNVVYELECTDCHETYVGQTSQWLRNRMNLHKSDIRTNNLRCALSVHANKYSHSVDFNNVKILDVNVNYKKRCILEMIHIQTQKSKINKKTDTQRLSPIYAYLIEFSNRPFFDGPVDE